MNIIELDNYKDYDNTIEAYHNFNSGVFNYNNIDKVEHLAYLLFKDTKVRAGIVGGYSKGGEFSSSFSAPFGGFSFKKESIKISDIEKSLELLEEWAIKQDIKKINIILPPIVYDNKFISKMLSCFYRANYKIDTLDLNYHFNTDKIKDEELYISNNLWHSARKSLKRSLKENLEFIVATSEDEKKEAYLVIKSNRKTKGYPLRMEFEDIAKTDSFIKKDFFLVKKDGISIASAIVYHVAKDIVQVVYWGDILEYSSIRAMNFLSYSIFKYYRDNSIKHIDIGPSTENSLPNYGLCEFKESIGCDITPKYIFSKMLKD